MGKCLLLCGPESSETLVLLLRWSWIKQPASNAFLYWFPLLSCFAPLSVMSAAGVTSPGKYQHSHITCPRLCFLGDPSKMCCEKALIRPAVQMRNKSATYLRLTDGDGLSHHSNRIFWLKITINIFNPSSLYTRSLLNEVGKFNDY